MTDDEKEVILGLASELLERLGIKAGVEVAESEEESIQVDISGQDMGILIGRHGETLQALQLILSLMVNQAIGEWKQLVVDIDGWRERRREQLERMARRAAEDVGMTKEEQILPPMAPYERRLVHLVLADNEDIETESVGEEPERSIVVKPA